MIHNIFVTPKRFLSKSHREIIKCPEKDGDKLLTNSKYLFIKKNYKKAAMSGKKPIEVLDDLRKKFSTLSQSELWEYEGAARLNRRVVNLRRSAFRASDMSGYGYFVKQQYGRLAQSIQGNNGKKFQKVSRILARTWRRMKRREKAIFQLEAAKIRKDSTEERSRMIAHHNTRRNPQKVIPHTTSLTPSLFSTPARSMRISIDISWDIKALATFQRTPTAG